MPESYRKKYGSKMFGCMACTYIYSTTVK